MRGKHSKCSSNKRTTLRMAASRTAFPFCPFFRPGRRLVARLRRVSAVNLFNSGGRMSPCSSMWPATRRAASKAIGSLAAWATRSSAARLPVYRMQGLPSLPIRSRRSSRVPRKLPVVLMHGSSRPVCQCTERTLSTGRCFKVGESSTAGLGSKWCEPASGGRKTTPDRYMSVWICHSGSGSGSPRHRDSIFATTSGVTLDMTSFASSRFCAAFPRFAGDGSAWRGVLGPVLVAVTVAFPAFRFEEGNRAGPCGNARRPAVRGSIRPAARFRVCQVRRLLSCWCGYNSVPAVPKRYHSNCCGHRASSTPHRPRMAPNEAARLRIRGAAIPVPSSNRLTSEHAPAPLPASLIEGARVASPSGYQEEGSRWRLGLAIGIPAPAGDGAIRLDSTGVG
jgi:hypothetical protein